MIRLMTIADYEAVSGLWRTTAGMGLRSLDDSKAGICAFLERNPRTCFVAESALAIIGAILCGNDGRRAYIYHTAVHAEHRNHGIGAALVAAVEQSLRDIGINKVALVAYTTNTVGNAFWERLGYTLRPDLIYRNKTLVDQP
ncbi:MAG: GNAT family N-acetyltransferase [Treponema sp.]|nr:GNAT family N-acetyltransferase [Treponema sp.]